MVRLYYDLIKAGLWTIERVPVTWRADVQKMLDEEQVKEITGEDVA